MNKVVIIIPARYDSSRLPGKPLVDILGKPMIQHVYERAKQVAGVENVIVATDDERISNVVHGFGGLSLMTSSDHASGTDRLVEVMKHIRADIYVNLQGDEPMIRPEDISHLVEQMQHDTEIQVGTLCHYLPAGEANNPNHVKVVLTDCGDAIYFSRSLIPFPRDPSKAEYLKHIGIYAYRRSVLERYNNLPKSMPEDAENLEQLRLLLNGIRIRAYKVEPSGPGVDTPSCLEHVRSLMSGALTPAEPLSSLSKIKLVITDVDGVLTDGTIIYNEHGESVKCFHVRDGLGIRMLELSGIHVAVVSGRDSPALRKRVSDLGISLFSFGVKDKAEACIDLMHQVGASAHQTACIGDDSIDLPAFEVCGLSYAVADAPAYVKACASTILQNSGGRGAFRELSDAILHAKGVSHIYETASGFRNIMANSAQ